MYTPLWKITLKLTIILLLTTPKITSSQYLANLFLSFSLTLNTFQEGLISPSLNF